MSRLKEMTRTLIHRGPDDEGFYFGEDINLGMRRLAVVDLETGRQPIHNEDESVWVVFNGEIYNHRELRERLLSRDHRFCTDHSDTEVIVHLYEEEGEDFVNELNGMFAIALWDSRKRKLSLYRDRLGKKPLYYTEKEGNLYFASELKALLRLPNLSRELDLTALSNYFSHKNISPPRTAFRDIKQLLPGHHLAFQDGRPEEKPYWRPDFSNPIDISEKEASGEILRLLDDAVYLRMQCDVPFGAYLSGGVDSSAVVTLMQRHNSKPIKTFCLGYEEDFKNKESDVCFAREVAQRLGTEHYEYRMSAQELPEMLPEVIKAFDEPFSGTISTFFLSLLIKRHVKVALSGDGADELFGSYLSHRLAFPIDAFLKLSPEKRLDPRLLTKEEIEEIRPFDDPEQFKLLSEIADSSIGRWKSRLNVFSDPEKKNLFADGLLTAGHENVYEKLSGSLTAKDSLNQVLEMDQKELLPNQVLPFVDRLSMAHSIEIRVPYLDYRLVEFVAQLSGRMKIHKGQTKFILKKAVEGILPQELINRTKEGFVLPVYLWLRTSLKNYVNEVLSEERIKKTRLLSPSYVDQLVKEFRHGVKNEAKIWNLICFQVWWEQYCG